MYLILVEYNYGCQIQVMLLRNVNSLIKDFSHNGQWARVTDSKRTSLTISDFILVSSRCSAIHLDWGVLKLKH